jgi:hypothetical protein
LCSNLSFMLPSDISQLFSGDVSHSFLRTSLGAFAARLCLRPALLTVNPEEVCF